MKIFSEVGMAGNLKRFNVSRETFFVFFSFFFMSLYGKYNFY